MKIIFQDFDGVLNSSRWSRERHARYEATGVMEEWPQGHIDPAAVAVLNDIVEKTGAMLVVSSVWRIGKQRTWLQDQLNAKGFRGKVLGTTPLLNTQRGLEIKDWLDNSAGMFKRRLGPVTHYVILDDDTDMASLYEKLVHIDYETGLTPDHVPAIMKHLTGKPLCGCHCEGGCCDPYAPCAYPCKDHIPL